jgi:pseudouridine-5'-phosphate glycosidase
VADPIRARDRLDLPGATLVTVPPPEEAAVPRPTLAPTIERALADAADRDLQAGAVTPFPLQRLRQIEGDRIIETNRALLRRNARVATRVGQALWSNLEGGVRVWGCGAGRYTGSFVRT